MRSKIGYGLMGVTIAFLLATNPVVVNAAGTITGADVKNSSLTGKDVKNGSLKSADFGTGQIPAGPTGATGATGATGPTGPAGPIGPIRRVNTNVPPVAANATSAWAFVHAPQSVTLTASQALLGSITASLQASPATTTSLGLCTQLGAAPLAVFASGWHIGVNISTLRQDHTVSAATGGLAAGTYHVGLCANTNGAFTGDYTTGFVQVVPAGVVSRAGGDAGR